jgi:hypothetical protein
VGAGAGTLRGAVQPDGEEGVHGARFGAPGLWDGGERLSDMPTQMRDPAFFEARRPNREFPWRYLGVLVLTAVAYFAWLYLLDHI